MAHPENGNPDASCESDRVENIDTLELGRDANWVLLPRELGERLPQSHS